ncbi:Tyrosine-protein phosphatase non-receptor type 3 [Linnemannia elongata]|nr:Tyrosine-protein phosphatase non-receptor type 3 [Linnemannia elongata]
MDNAPTPTLPGFLRPEARTSRAHHQHQAFEGIESQEADRLELAYGRDETLFSFREATLPHTVKLNRYSNVLPYHHSRVMVNGPMPFMNANRITAPPALRTSLPADFAGYIATQAPLPETQSNFWRMVLDQNVHVIVCLTSVSTDRTRRGHKAEQYWPNAGQTDQFGPDLWVRNLDSTDSNNEVVYRNLELWDPSSDANTRRPILLAHYQGWPDHGVPRSSNSLRDIMYTIRSWKRNQQAHIRYPHFASHPLRDASLQEQALNLMVQAEDAYNWNQERDLVFEILNAFRTERMLMVQTTGQYQFCYAVVKDLCQ